MKHRMKASYIVFTSVLAASLIAACPSFAAAPTKTPVRVLTLVLRPSGFAPPQLSVPAGYVHLVILNRTGINQISYSLDDDKGAHVNSLTLAQKKKDWTDFVKLTPGKLILSVPSVPRLRCSITVTPQ